MTVLEALLAPRFHDQLISSQVFFEYTFDNGTVAFMQEKGHNIRFVETRLSSVQAVRWLANGTFEAAGEPRQKIRVGMLFRWQRCCFLDAFPGWNDCYFESCRNRRQNIYGDWRNVSQFPDLSYIELNNNAFERWSAGNKVCLVRCDACQMTCTFCLYLYSKRRRRAGVKRESLPPSSGIPSRFTH